MGLGDGAHQRQPQAAAGHGAALFKAHKAFENGLALVFGHARPGVGDRNGNAAIALAAQAQRHRAAPGRVFEGIVQEVGDGLGEQSLVSPDQQALFALHLEIHSLVFGHGRKHFGQIMDQRRRVHAVKALALFARLQPGNAQHRIEGFKQGFGIVQGALQHRSGVLVRRFLQGPDLRFQAVAHARQRRAQVMGDGIAGMAGGGHQLFDPAQHGIQIGSQFV